MLHQATGSRAPGASSRRSRPTHWLGYTGETHRPGLIKTFDFLLVHGGGLRLYSQASAGTGGFHATSFKLLHPRNGVAPHEQLACDL
ncbi:MAG: hypothetical protein V7K27_02990 [Nostoc sp.]|uniref:hypothetical protein n=1 Tax=Nostoc sp. TaxID=1180 RepID=UPI002FFC1F25